MVLILVELSFLCYVGYHYLQQNENIPIAGESLPIDGFQRLLSKHEGGNVTITGWRVIPEGCTVIIATQSYGGEMLYQSQRFVKVSTQSGSDWYWDYVGRYYKVTY